VENRVDCIHLPENSQRLSFRAIHCALKFGGGLRLALVKLFTFVVLFLRGKAWFLPMPAPPYLPDLRLPVLNIKILPGHPPT